MHQRVYDHLKKGKIYFQCWSFVNDLASTFVCHFPSFHLEKYSTWPLDSDVSVYIIANILIFNDRKNNILQYKKKLSDNWKVHNIYCDIWCYQIIIIV